MTDAKSTRITPGEVTINFAPREPITDVTLGIAVPAGTHPCGRRTGWSPSGIR